MTDQLARRRVVLVTGLSGGGRSSILRALEDVGYEAIDNAPLEMLEHMISRGGGRLAMGVDARTRGFDPDLMVECVSRLRRDPALRVDLVFAWANDSVLLRRFTETRRPHPLAPQGRVIDGVVAERALVGGLREFADLAVDSSELPLAALRRLVEENFAGEAGSEPRLVISLVSFAYREGLPLEADMVFDARFLRNPHYDPILRPRTGLDPEVGAYVAADPDFDPFFTRLTALVELVLPRFVTEGKRYATLTIGCTGGRHRSVYLVERLAACLADRIASDQKTGGAGVNWRLHVTHRELARERDDQAFRLEFPVPGRATSDIGEAPRSSPVQAQEA
jgi:RNase adapter protein RapZ